MSTATAFVFPGSFPFCVEDQSGGIGASFDYVGNLTLAEVMAFYWNLETFTLTFAGTATNASGTRDAAGSWTTSPAAGTPFDEGLVVAGEWFTTPTSYTVWASWPTVRTPRARVCIGGALTNGTIQSFVARVSTIHATDLGITFALSTDPSNAGKYRLYYVFSVDFDNVSDSKPLINFCNPNNAGAGTQQSSGTMTIGGVTFDWLCATTGATSTSGLTMSAASTSFTY